MSIKSLVSVVGADSHFCEITIQGKVDESFDRHAASEIKQPTVFIDLEDIVFINSCGVRELVFFFQSLSDKNIVLKRIPKIIVDQMNMIEGLTGPNIKIESFYAPYLNPKTGKTMDLLLIPAEVIDEQPPLKKDPVDKSELEFDDLSEIYFRFLS